MKTAHSLLGSLALLSAGLFASPALAGSSVDTASVSTASLPWALEIEGVEIGRFASAEGFAATSASAPVLALSAGLLRSDEFLGDWGALLDGELDALEIALVRRDRYGKLISRSVFDGRPLLLEIVTPEGETLRAMNADGVEEMDDTLSTLGTDGILISVVWIGPHRPREEPKK